MQKTKSRDVQDESCREKRTLQQPAGRRDMDRVRPPMEHTLQRWRGMHLPGRVLCLQQLSQEKKSAPAVCAWIHVTDSPAPGQGRQRQPEGSSLRVTVERPAGQEDKETESDQTKH